MKAFYVVTRPRITWETYVVEAENAEEARGGNGTYVGVTDGDYFNGATIEVSEPFSSEKDALESPDAHTEWQ